MIGRTRPSGAAYSASLAVCVFCCVGRLITGNVSGRSLSEAGNRVASWSLNTEEECGSGIPFRLSPLEGCQKPGEPSFPPGAGSAGVGTYIECSRRWCVGYWAPPFDIHLGGSDLKSSPP